MSETQLHDGSIVKLRPCRFVRETADRYGVVRRGGMSRVVVRRSGLEACARLREGCAIEDAKRDLANRHRTPEQSIDLGPLLRSLQRADLIASVDGKPLPESRPPSLYSAYRYFLRFHLKARLLRLAYKSLPKAIGRRLAYWTHRLDLSAVLWRKAERAEEHLRRSSRAHIPTAARAGFASRYFDHLVRNIVEFELVQSMTPAEVESWLKSHVEYEGLEHLVQAKSEGLPVILAGFHFSTTKLLSLLLMRRGFDATQVWMPDASVELAAVVARLTEFERDLPHYGKMELIPDFTLPSYRRLMKSLRDGGTLVWFADMFGSNETSAAAAPSQEWRDSAARIFDFALIRTEMPQSRIDVKLCGQSVYLNPWIGSFARSAGAVVIPSALIRQGNGMRLKLWPTLRLPANAAARDVDDLNRAIFERLNGLLHRHPEQWFGWHSLCPVPATDLSDFNKERR
jgi:lauroyl/myristoyl acyltransferase